MAETNGKNIIVTKDLVRTFKTMGGVVHACNGISIEVPEKQMTHPPGPFRIRKNHTDQYAGNPGSPYQRDHPI